MEQAGKVQMGHWVSHQVSLEPGDPVPASWTRPRRGGARNPPGEQPQPPGALPLSLGLSAITGCDDGFKCTENGVSPHRSKLC